jgi:phosphomannomutase
MSDTLIISVSGVRGIVGEGLTPELVGRFAAAMGSLVLQSGGTRVVLARDSRTSGPMFADAVTAGLGSVGCGVIDCGMIPTPTAQLAVVHHGAGGGIVITASHNPIEWNALKFIGADGIFLDGETGARLQALAEGDPAPPASGVEVPPPAPLEDADAMARHVEGVLRLSVLDVDRIRDRGFTVALDCARGVGGTIMPGLLERLGCRVAGMELEPDGLFTRPPEPVPENLGGLSSLVRESGADLGMATDPDSDRLALVDETGRPIGEDYTLAFGVRAVLSQTPGPVVVNLSTSLIVDDAAREYGVDIARVPVGEANVARAMLTRGAIVGGEGNGGVMLPELHVGRDAPVAAALALHLLAVTGRTVSEVVNGAPCYTIVKAKAPKGGDLLATYEALERRFGDATVDRQDGLRLAWNGSWLHVRPSGTEPIVRVIAEAPTAAQAEELVAGARGVFDGSRG